MARQVLHLNVLLSRPGDVQDEIEAAREVADELNDMLVKNHNVRIDLKDWSWDAAPELGKAPQEIINRELVDDCDGLVAIFRTRYGSPTKDYGSGTEEEIVRMIERGGRAMVFFSVGYVDVNNIDPEQLKLRNDLKMRMQSLGIYKEYENIEVLKNMLRRYLMDYAVEESRKRNVHSKTGVDLKYSDVVQKDEQNLSQSVDERDLQAEWTRILTDESLSAERLSRRRTELLNNLTAQEARIFQHVSALAIENNAVHFLPTDLELLEKHGVYLRDLMALQDAGLISVQRVKKKVDFFKDQDAHFVGTNLVGFLGTQMHEEGSVCLEVCVFTELGEELLPLAQSKGDTTGDAFLLDFMRGLRDSNSKARVVVYRVVSRSPEFQAADRLSNSEVHLKINWQGPDLLSPRDHT